MNALKYWGSVRKARPGNRGLGVYGSRGKHVLQKNLSLSQGTSVLPPTEQRTAIPSPLPPQQGEGFLSPANSAKLTNVATPSALSAISPPNNKKMGYSPSGKQLSSAALHHHQTVSALLATNMTIGLLSSRSFSESVPLSGRQRESPQQPTAPSPSNNKASGEDRKKFEAKVPGVGRVTITDPESLDTIKSDLVQVCKEQMDEIKATEDMSVHREIAQRFIRDSKFKVRDDPERGVAVMTITDPLHTVEVEFPLEEQDQWDGEEKDQDEDEFEEDEDETEQRRKEEEEADEEEDPDAPGIHVGPVRSGKYLPEPWPRKHPLSVNIIFKEKDGSVKGRWQLTGFAGEDNRLYIEIMRAALGQPPPKNEDGTDSINNLPPTIFDELNTAMQDRIYDFLDEVGVDDRVSHFVKAYIVEYKNRTDLGFLQNLTTLLEAGKEGGASSSSSSKQEQQKTLNKK